MKIIKKNTFKKNFSWNFLGNIVYAATQWGLIVAITRIGNVEMAGLYSLALAVTAPIMMFTNLELRTIQATEKDTNNNLSSFASLRLISNLLFLIILFLIMGIGDYSFETLLIIFLIAISKIIESWSDLTYGFFQRQERMEFISKSKIIRGIASLVTVAIVLLITENLIYAIIGLTTIWLILYIFYDLKNLKYFNVNMKISFSKNIIQIFKLALPLGVVALIVSLNSNLPKIFIENYLGVTMLGYFTTIFYFIMVGDKLVRAVFQVALPRLSTYHQENKKKKFHNLLVKMLFLATAIGVVGVMISLIWGESILVFIYGNEFYDYKNVFILIMIYGLFNYISASLLLGINSLQYFKVQPILSMIWLITILISSIYFIPLYGLIGAGITLIIYSIVRILTIVIVLKYGIQKEFV